MPRKYVPKRRETGPRVRYPYLAVDLQSPVVYRDQLFFPGGQRDIPSNRRAGETVRVDCWSTHCAECGQLFAFYTVPRSETAPFGFLRRCETHRRKGKPIDARRFRETRPPFEDVAEAVRDGKRMWGLLIEVWRAQDARDACAPAPCETGRG